MKTRLLTFLTLFFAARTSAQFPDNAAITKILADRIAAGQSVGIVVGVADESGRRIVSHGAARKGETAPIDGDTLFEIGSITKVFTSLLLVDMVARGEVKLDDPVAKLLNVPVPSRGGKEITLRHLASHTSGLPRLPSNLSPADETNPYVDYTAKQLYECLRTHELTRDPGATYEYSNLGAGLLGHALSVKAGKSYEALVSSRLFEPLHMTSTSITLSDRHKTKLARGHSITLDPAANWDFDALAGAGAIRSTVKDMLSFLEVAAGLEKSPLQPLFAETTSPRVATSMSGTVVALGWHITKTSAGEIIWHNGGTGGYRSFAGIDPKTRRAVIVLSNASTPTGVDDIGMHLLDRSSKLAELPKQRKAIEVAAAKLERFTGAYPLAPEFVLTVTREGNRLFVQATGQPKLELFAESEREFFIREVDAQITFDVDADGNATSLTLHQNGQSIPAKKTKG